MLMPSNVSNNQPFFNNKPGESFYPSLAQSLEEFSTSHRRDSFYQEEITVAFSGKRTVDIIAIKQMVENDS